MISRLFFYLKRRYVLLQTPRDATRRRAAVVAWGWKGLLMMGALGFPNIQLAQSAKITADSNHVETGNPIVLHLSIAADHAPDSINYLPWQPGFEPKNKLEESPWRRSGAELHKDITLLFFDADTIQLAPLAITFDGRDTLFTNALDLEIHATPSPDDLNDMAPIKDIRREQVLWTDYLPIVVMILAGLAIVALLFWWMSRKKKRKSLSRAVEMPAHELALKKLNALEKKALWQQGGVKEYCAELTFVLREYLEKRFGLPALESSSEALLHALDHSSFPPEHKEELRELLFHADMAKFAKGIPPDSFPVASMAFAVKLVRETILVESPEDPSSPDHPQSVALP